MMETSARLAPVFWSSHSVMEMIPAKHVKTNTQVAQKAPAAVRINDTNVQGVLTFLAYNDSKPSRAHRPTWHKKWNQLKIMQFFHPAATGEPPSLVVPGWMTPFCSSWCRGPWSRACGDAWRTPTQSPVRRRSEPRRCWREVTGQGRWDPCPGKKQVVSYYYGFNIV